MRRARSWLVGMRSFRSLMITRKLAITASGGVFSEKITNAFVLGTALSLLPKL
jgi:hypothetical protein